MKSKEDPIIIENKQRSKEELQSLTFAEENRETHWKSKSFLGSIFMGDMDFSLCSPFKTQDDSDKKIGDILCQEIDDWAKKAIDGEKIDKDGKIPSEVMKEMHKLKLFCLKIPKKFGGLELSQNNYMRVLSVIGKYCTSCATLLSAHQSIGLPQPLKLFGSDEQKQKYLPRISAGEITAFALTEYEVGSDPANLTTTAEPSEDGQDWILNGVKLWCTNGVIADLYVVMARTPDLVKEDKKIKQVTAFIVEAKWKGVEVLHRSDFMGLKGIENGVIKFTNVKIPKENIIGSIGKGLKLALATLNDGRLSIPAISASGALEIAKFSNSWAKSRSQWGKAIGYHEPGAQKVAYINSCAYAMETFSNYCALLSDHKKTDIRMEAAAAKLWSTEELWKIVDMSIQLHGGRGYETQSSLEKRGEIGTPLERIMRDIRINRILEGSSEIMHLFLAREALDVHFKKAGVLLSKGPIKTKLKGFMECALFYPRWYLGLWLGMFFDFFKFDMSVSGCFRSHLKWIKIQTRKLALTLFHKMIFLGPKLEFKQLTLARIIDIGVELSILALIISRTHDQIKNGNTENKEIALFWINERKLHIKKLFKEINMNTDNNASKLTKEILSKASVLPKPSPSTLKAMERVFAKDLLN